MRRPPFVVIPPSTRSGERRALHEHGSRILNHPIPMRHARLTNMLTKLLAEMLTEAIVPEKTSDNRFGSLGTPESNYSGDEDFVVGIFKAETGLSSEGSDSFLCDCCPFLLLRRKCCQSLSRCDAYRRDRGQIDWQDSYRQDLRAKKFWPIF